MFPSLILLASLLAPVSAPPATEEAVFRISFPESVRAEALTGRVYVAVAPSESRVGMRRGRGRGPIALVSETGVPLFGKNVEALAPGAWATIGSEVIGYPVEDVRKLPPGSYRVQAFANVYTKCERSDGHTVWMPLDRGEGQVWRQKPGNLRSAVTTVEIGPDRKGPIDLTLTEVLPPVTPMPNTKFVERFEIESKLLTEFWGQPIKLGATVLLPKGYHENPDVKYPIHYVHGHFSRRAPGGFGRGGAFDRMWLAEETARMIMVTIQHPSPYYDDSYAVNSENNGPYGDAIHQELIEEIETRYRVIREPWARQLSGGSTGGWIALALQIFHPEFYGGCWASCPDSPDFRYHQIVDIYRDPNAYWIDHGFMKVDRPTRRRTDGNIVSMMKDENWYELAVGDKNRSGGQWDIWEATFSPVGEDGYPKRLWDKRTGVIDPEVAKFWRENYDLRHILERDWKTLGPKLVGKIHVFMGDMDSYYLNNGCYLLEKFLESTKDPAYGGSFEYARLRGHCWGPSSPELLKRLVAHLEAHAPEGADLKSWRYP